MRTITKPMINVVCLLIEAHQTGSRLHGWAIAKATGHAAATVYGVIDRLENAHWITGEWEELSGDQKRPRRRYYQLTKKGLESARALMIIQSDLA